MLILCARAVAPRCSHRPANIIIVCAHASDACVVVSATGDVSTRSILKPEQFAFFLRAFARALVTTKLHWLADVGLALCADCARRVRAFMFPDLFTIWLCALTVASAWSQLKHAPRTARTRTNQLRLCDCVVRLYSATVPFWEGARSRTLSCRPLPQHNCWPTHLRTDGRASPCVRRRLYASRHV